eukprot:Skav214983  [mRNA]  locus=scaffold508:225165:225800:+ [translate_table: standard]
MTLDTMHRLMLPSDRTLQIMAAVDLPQNEGNYKTAPRAPFSHTIHCMVFSVLVHLCLWIGCDVRFPARGPCFPGRWAIIALMALPQLNGQHGAPGLVAWVIFVVDIFLETLFWHYLHSLAFICLLPMRFLRAHAQTGRQRLLAVSAKHCWGQGLCSYKLHGRQHGDKCMAGFSSDQVGRSTLATLLTFAFSLHLWRPDLLLPEPTTQDRPV